MCERQTHREKESERERKREKESDKDKDKDEKERRYMCTTLRYTCQKKVCFVYRVARLQTKTDHGLGSQLHIVEILHDLDERVREEEEARRARIYHASTHKNGIAVCRHTHTHLLVGPALPLATTLHTESATLGDFLQVADKM